MHCKGLTAAALLLFAVLLAGCGGGGDEGRQSAPQASSTSSSPATTSTGEVQLPEQVQAKLKRARRKAIEERKAEEKSPSAKPPRVEHHDSGGGSAQLETKGGDNSIVEYGQEASASEREAAATSLHAYLDSLVARRWAAACSYMSLGLIAGLEQLPQLAKQKTDIEGCPEILEALNGNTPDSALQAGAKADVVSLRAQGDRAMVIYRGPADRGYVMPMVREEGVWRVSSPAGTPAL